MKGGKGKGKKGKGKKAKKKKKKDKKKDKKEEGDGAEPEEREEPEERYEREEREEPEERYEREEPEERYEREERKVRKVPGKYGKLKQEFVNEPLTKEYLIKSLRNLAKIDPSLEIEIINKDDENRTKYHINYDSKNYDPKYKSYFINYKNLRNFI